LIPEIFLINKNDLFLFETKPEIDRIVFANHSWFTRVKPRIIRNIESSFFYIRYYERIICLSPQKIRFSTCNRFIRFKLWISTNKAIKNRIKRVLYEVKKKINPMFFVIFLFFSIISDFFFLLGIYLKIYESIQWWYSLKLSENHFF
jgi:hypothetical protein